jgi:acetyl-CoA/propionyl-CoA carboxylase biotin carboxyl carrier protein
MENPVTAHKAGTVGELHAETGTTVGQGTVLCTVD